MYVVKTMSAGHSRLQLLPSYIDDPCLQYFQHSFLIKPRVQRIVRDLSELDQDEGSEIRDELVKIFVTLTPVLAGFKY